MAPAPIEVVVGGKAYRVIASESAEVLQRLARSVDDKLAEVAPPGQPVPERALLLAALALAHDLDEERARRRELEGQLRQRLRGVLSQIDRALGSSASAAPLPDATERDPATSPPGAREPVPALVLNDPARSRSRVEAKHERNDD